MVYRLDTILLLITCCDMIRTYYRNKWYFRSALQNYIEMWMCTRHGNGNVKKGEGKYMDHPSEVIIKKFYQQ